MLLKSPFRKKMRVATRIRCDQALHWVGLTHGGRLVFPHHTREDFALREKAAVLGDNCKCYKIYKGWREGNEPAVRWLSDVLALSRFSWRTMSIGARYTHLLGQARLASRLFRKHRDVILKSHSFTLLPLNYGWRDAFGRGYTALAAAPFRDEAAATRLLAGQLEQESERIRSACHKSWQSRLTIVSANESGNESGNNLWVDIYPNRYPGSIRLSWNVNGLTAASAAKILPIIHELRRATAAALAADKRRQAVAERNGVVILPGRFE